jgi:hypothetical protein
MKKIGFAAIAFLCFLAMPPAEAEAQVTFGPQVSLWDFEEVGIGAKVDIGLGETLGIEDGALQNLSASLDGNYMFGTGDLTMTLFNLNAQVPFDIDAGVTPYAGTGLNHWRVSGTGPFASGGTSGLNILGGLSFDLGQIPAFTQLQYSTTGFGYLTVSAGVMFGG